MTSGKSIIGTLLRENPELIAIVPATSIKTGRLGDVALPAVLVRRISKIQQRQTLKRNPGPRRRVERVSVTVRAASEREREEILQRVEDICSGRTGDLGGGTGVSILDAGAGPDLDGPGDGFEGTQDFRVSFDA